jgi:hypothetical protein
VCGLTGAFCSQVSSNCSFVRMRYISALSSDDETSDREDRAVPQLHFLIDQVAEQVTSGQGGREWFHLRIFRPTSTVAHSVFDVASHMLRSANVDTIKPFCSCHPYPTKESLTQDTIEVLKRKIKTLNISPPGTKTAANYVKVLMDFTMITMELCIIAWCTQLVHGAFFYQVNSRGFGQRD